MPSSRNQHPPKQIQRKNLLLWCRPNRRQETSWYQYAAERPCRCPLHCRGAATHSCSALSALYIWSWSTRGQPSGSSPRARLSGALAVARSDARAASTRGRLLSGNGSAEPAASCRVIADLSFLSCVVSSHPPPCASQFGKALGQQTTKLATTQLADKKKKGAKTCSPMKGWNISFC